MVLRVFLYHLCLINLGALPTLWCCEEYSDTGTLQAQMLLQGQCGPAWPGSCEAKDRQTQALAGVMLY